ncbi:MAG: DUF1957 domain-containing protein [Verrucomicrobia bacterium]|nr:DUF1957 domain-containing protein [Verrucomicrobiota bacterium]
MTARGSLALVLHAHLPFVRHTEQEHCAEERWLFEAITESYVPLLQMLRRLRDEQLPFKITLSISPTLAAMLHDDLLRERYRGHLESLIALAHRECERNRNSSDLLSLSTWYAQLFTETYRLFFDEWHSELLSVVRRLRDDGALELVATAATHAILPILQQTPAAARAQIAIGCDVFRELFAAEPAGFWLPECAYAPEIDALLARQNIRWFVVDSHALALAQPPARGTTLSPCFTPAGPAAFARDAQASRHIWDAHSGYPGDRSYRDFYRDIGFDLPAPQLAPLDHAQGQFTGIKYHRVTGVNGAKEVYNRGEAVNAARRHAQHFVEQCAATLHNSDGDSDEPILVAPFDAELFGHWWFEGPVFLEYVIRIAAEMDLRLSTPTDCLRNNPPLQVVQPAASSWGERGYFDVWLDEKCAWIYPELFAAAQKMIELANRHVQGKTHRADEPLRQLARELLLAQASDWPFHIRNGTASEYAARRVRDHLARFHRLAAAIDSGKSEAGLPLGDSDAAFPRLDWRYFADCHPERTRGSCFAA